jgi:hypothetical protein
MKKVLIVFVVLAAICCGVSYISYAEEVDATGALAGIWDVVETYEGAGDYYATWELTPRTGRIYSLTATRDGGYVQEGIGIETSRGGILKHDCYGEGCGDCGYTFKGQISGSTFSGTATYKCSDGSVYPGTFTATKTSGGSVDSVPESDGVDPQ